MTESVRPPKKRSGKQASDMKGDVNSLVNNAVGETAEVHEDILGDEISTDLLYNTEHLLLVAIESTVLVDGGGGPGERRRVRTPFRLRRRHRKT